MNYEKISLPEALSPSWMFLCSEQPAPLSTAAEAKSVLVSPAASTGPGTQSSLDKCLLN